MNFLRPFLFVAVALLFASCAVTPFGRKASSQSYQKVTVTDLRGKLVAEWIAEGSVKRHGEGYRFFAVQRLSAPPYVVLAKYPQGRTVSITGPNIIVAPCGKPQWLYELDGF